MAKTYEVKLDQFEGPLDLLLHLVQQYEIDIYEVPLTEVIDQYTEFIHTMQYLELNIASEYLVMAATLIAVKSQMLLPKQEVMPEDEYIEDPEEELMQRLIRYRKYKEAAEQLKNKDDHQIFTRPTSLLKYSEEDRPIERGNVSVYDMIGAIGRMLKRKQWSAPLETRVTRVEIPIEQRMEEIMHLIERTKQRISFDSLFTYPSRSHIVVTFIAVLELMMENAIYCQQENNFESIYIYSAKETDATDRSPLE